MVGGISHVLVLIWIFFFNLSGDIDGVDVK